MSPIPPRPEVLTNRHFWCTLTTNAPSKKVWSIWADVSNWQTWDTGLEYATLEGKFGEGATGKIRSGGTTSSFRVTAFSPGRSYTITTALPLAKLHVNRTLCEREGETSITHEVWFSGLLAGLFAGVFGRKFRSLLPNVVANVKNLAECS